ncbi:hypothetical protein FDECE_17993 [Fusarium decemcellulare]|nr:hypothetical protein FDECE_17993 [Fusarium decemcellulare]
MADRDALQKNLRAILENRRSRGWLLEPPAPGSLADIVDFGSNDTLSLASSGLLGEKFVKELELHPNFVLGGRAARPGEGTTDYLLQLEEDIARFHNAESALFFHTGYEANVAVYSTIPQQGDVVLYDELIHASIREGVRKGRAGAVAFAHNDVFSLRSHLEAVIDQHAGIRRGDSLVFVALESFYSMDGDVAPIQAMIKEIKGMLPMGNAVFVIDEAHSSGLIGPRESGLVCHLGLEKDCAIRLHTYGKAHGASGAAVLSSRECKQVLLSSVRGLIFSTAPAFITLLAVRVGYDIIGSHEGEARRRRLQSNVITFYKAITTHAAWDVCQRLGIVAVPIESTHSMIRSPIIPIITRTGEAVSLGKYLQEAKLRVLVVHFPTVPKDKERLRINIHADHSRDELLSLASLIMEWAQARPRSGKQLSHL